MGKYAVISQFLCLHFFFNATHLYVVEKIIVNQIWQLGTNEHRRDSCISPNVQMWQLIVTRLISVVHQTVTGTIWHTKCANWWQTVVTFWFNWSISLKNTCIKKNCFENTVLQSYFPLLLPIYWRESLKMVHHWWWYLPSCYALYIHI